MIVYHGTSVEFDKFDLRFTSELGLHFGDYGAAVNRLRELDRRWGLSEWIILECEIPDGPYISLRDIGDWGDYPVIAAEIEAAHNGELAEVARRYSGVRYDDPAWGEKKAAFRRDLLALGYAGVEYENAVEGGISYMVLDDRKIKILRRVK